MRNKLFFVFIIATSSLFGQNDSSYYAKLLKEKVWSYSYQKDSDIAWVIAGEIPNKVYRIKKDKVRNISKEAHLPEKNRYTSISFLSNKHILLSTSNNYIFYLRGNKRYKWLNQDFGLKDSCVTSIDLVKKQKILFANTPSAKYLLKNYNRYYKLYFTEIKDSTHTIEELAYFFKYYIQKPIQQGICFVASDVDFSFTKEKMIKGETLQKIKDELKPGDLIIKRNDYQLANVGIPGFWTHSGIYLGSLEELDSCFANLPILEGASVSHYLKENYPIIYEKMLNKQSLIIEAIGRGVVINPVEHIAKVDYLAAMRTNLATCDLFQSLLSAFDYYGTPYDYLFDFQNDDAVVCSELIYQAFKPSAEKHGVDFILGSYQNKPFLSPNDIARHYALEFNRPNPQLKLIYFYDADRHSRRSVRRSEHAFAKTWIKKQ